LYSLIFDLSVLRLIQAFLRLSADCRSFLLKTMLIRAFSASERTVHKDCSYLYGSCPSDSVQFLFEEVFDGVRVVFPLSAGPLFSIIVPLESTQALLNILQFTDIARPFIFLEGRAFASLDSSFSPVSSFTVVSLRKFFARRGMSSFLSRSGGS